jgi:lipid II:glycine glycyltransferase (peptidoglycan interpeptide bridge formation enzyme)
MVRFRVETIPCTGELDLHDEQAFLNSVVRHFRHARADVIIPASTNTIFRTYPDDAIAAPYGTHIVDLAQPEAALWAAISANHRRQVRAAEKLGVRIRTDDEYLTTAHSIIRDTFGKSSMRFMRLDALTRMVRGLGEDVHVFVADQDGRVQSCAVMAFSRHSAYYMYGGSIADAAPGSMHLLHWEAMRLYRQLGVRRYDFCGARVTPAPGSKAEGLATFKQRFGARFHQGFMWKCRISAWKSAVYSLAVRHLRGGDIVDVERHKLRAVVAGKSDSRQSRESYTDDQ